MVLASPKIYSQLFVENFDYPAVPPTVLSTTIQWAISSIGINPILVDVPGGLTFPPYAFSGVGNAVTLLTSGEDDTARFNAPVSSGSVYSSFMINVASAQTTGDYFYSVIQSGTFNFYSRVYIRLMKLWMSGYLS